MRPPESARSWISCPAWPTISTVCLALKRASCPAIRGIPNFTDITPAQLTDIRTAFAEAGIEISVLSCYQDLSNPDTAIRENAVAAVCRALPARANFPPGQGLGVAGGPARGLTAVRAILNILQLMSAEVPEILDAWRMVAARRGFKGRLPLSSMPRLGEVLLDAEGEVAFALDFDRDALNVAYVELRIDAALPLQCQRTLQRFLLPVQVVQRHPVTDEIVLKLRLVRV